jgi:hypothetical protein
MEAVRAAAMLKRDASAMGFKLYAPRGLSSAYTIRDLLRLSDIPFE